MLISGHKSLDCLEKYLKFPQSELIEELLQHEKAEAESLAKDQALRVNETCFVRCLKYLRF